MTASTDVFDELAALFLTEPVAECRTMRTAPTARRRPAVEVLLQGHLPVRGSLWVGAFADALARDRGSVAILRLDVTEASVEVFRAPGSVVNGGDQHSLGDIAERLAGDVSTWIVRPVPGTPLPELLAAGADRLTILTGCDEAATVALYQSIKQLYDAGVAGGQALPPVAAAIVGCDESRARAVLERLNRTTSAFLGVPVELAACLPRIDAGIRSSRRTPVADAPGMTFDDVVATLVSARRAAAVTDRGLNNGAPQAPDEPRSAPAPRALTDRLLHASATDSTSPARGAVAASVDPVAAGPTRLPPKPAMLVAQADWIDAPDPEPEPTTAIASPRDVTPAVGADSAHAPAAPLVAHLQGLHALTARCPGHESVELAVDDAGRLHVVGRAEALRQLVIVQRWAARHAALIAMSCPHRTFNLAAGALLDVVTDQPLAVADLHGTDVRLHVLAPVRLGDQTAWYAAPLNQPAP